MLLGVLAAARECRPPTRRPAHPPPAQLESLPAMVQGVWSEDPQAQLEATTQFRKLLSIGARRPIGRRALQREPPPLPPLSVGGRPTAAALGRPAPSTHVLPAPTPNPAERNPPIEEVIAQNVIPRFVQFLQRSDLPQLQFEAAWALTNVSPRAAAAGNASVHAAAAACIAWPAACIGL